MSRQSIPQNVPHDPTELETLPPPAWETNGAGAAPPVSDPYEDLRKFAVDSAGLLTQADSQAQTAGSAEDGAEAARAEFWGPRLFTVGEFLQRPPKEYLVDKVLGARDFALVFGESGHGKTFVALDLAYACATGAATFAETFTITRPLSVCYATGEGAGGLADRLRAVSTFYGSADVPFYVFADIPQLFNTTGDDGVLSFVREWQELAEAGRVPAQLDLLILDTLHTAQNGAEENSAKDAGVTQRSLRYLRDTLGCAVLLVHHASRAGNERGSTALKGAMDTVLKAQKLGHSYMLSCEKLKDGEAWPALSFDLVSVNNCTSVRVFWQGQAKSGTSQKSRKAQALEWLQANGADWHTATEVGAAVGLEDSKAVYEYLDALVKAGDVESKGARPKLFKAKSVSQSQSLVSTD